MLIQQLNGMSSLYKLGKIVKPVRAIGVKRKLSSGVEKQSFSAFSSQSFSTQPHYQTQPLQQHNSSLPKNLPAVSFDPLSPENIALRISKLNTELEPFAENPVAVIRHAFKAFNSRLAMSTSFGIQSSILLHLATQVFPEIPVIFVDTGYLPKETYLYAEELKDVLKLNLIVKTNDSYSPARMEALYGKLWEHEDANSHNLYGKLRKVDPMNAALSSLNPKPLALLSGLRASQTKARANMDLVSFTNGNKLYKVLPMLKMSDEDVMNYIDKHDLPKHPLQAKGYVTVGDWHSSRPLTEAETAADARNTRFGGKFQECGLHAEETNDSTTATATTTTTAAPATGSTTASTQSLVKELEEIEKEEAKENESLQLKSFLATKVSALNEVKVNPVTELAVMMIKKVTEDGEFCRKCNDVAAKLQSDKLEQYIGGVCVADLRDNQSDGVKLAKFFNVQTAPFFLVRSKAEEANKQEWRIVRSYLQLKKTIEESLSKIEASSI